MEDVERTNAWKFMDPPMRDLVRQSFQLLQREEANQDFWHDYSFIIFPAAKAYEGFLKKLFFTLGFIKRQQYLGDRFRIGRALNPNLPKRYQWDWVYGKLLEYCKGEQLPLRLWEAWKRGRNQTFHYMPEHRQMVALSEARDILVLLSEVMNAALNGCNVVY
jgi:hypothetical protein